MKRTQWISSLAAGWLIAFAVSAVAQPAPGAAPGAAKPADAAAKPADAAAKPADAAKPAAPAAKPAAPATPPVSSPFPNDTDTLSYVIGYNWAKTLKQSVNRDNVEVNSEVVALAVKDALAGAESKMTEEQTQQFMTIFQKNLMAKQQERAAKIAAEGKKWLEENAKKEGIKSLTSGLQYKIIKDGTGAKPKATDSVQVNYEGRLTDGKVFDSSAKHGGPAEFPVTGVIPGWTEALQLMKEGSKWQIFVPGNLAYPRGQGEIPPNATLMFDVELLKVIPSSEGQPTVQIPQQKPQQPAPPKTQ